MSTLPAPLVPKGVSLTGCDWFPLHHQRLPKSKWWRRASDMARARNVMLWCAAYSQSPAGSLPDDDDELAEAAGFGMDMVAFAAAKAEIMAPWKLCSDGRWYHPTLAEVVLETWDKQTESRKAAAERKRRSRDRARGAPEEVTRDTNIAAQGEPTSVTREIAIQTEKTEKTEIEESPSDPPLAAKVEDLGADDMLAAMFGDPGPDAPASGPDPADRGTGPMLTALPKDKRRARKVPDTWSPTPAHDTIAFGELGMTTGQFDLQLAMFRDYEFKDGKTDWDAAFRNWLRKAATSMPRGSVHDRQAVADHRLDNLRRAFTAPSLTALRGTS